MEKLVSGGVGWSDVIIGSNAFVKEMASRHSLCFGEVTVKVRQYVLGMVKTYATHGQRSTPAEAA